MFVGHLDGKQRRSALFLSGLLTLTAGALLVASASQTTLIVADRELRGNWRTTYDILVRPAGARSPIEEKHGLVESNHLSGIWGGITFEQYETIKGLPGVEVAAPIAMLGYLRAWATTEDMAFPPEPGVYLMDQTAVVYDGARTYTPPEFPDQSYFYFDRSPLSIPSDPFGGYHMGDLIVNYPFKTINDGLSFPFLIAGIEADQEAALTKLNQAIVAGRYLTGEESLQFQFTIVPIEGYEFPEARISLPILINITNYVNLAHQAKLKRVILPPDISTPEEILAKGGSGYLDTLPTETLASTKMDGPAIYRKMLEAIAPQLFGLSTLLGTMVVMDKEVIEVPGAPVYQETVVPFDYGGLVLEIQLPKGEDEPAWPRYRSSVGHVNFNVLFAWDPKGLFDIERLARPQEVVRVPLETYFPPTALLRYDEQGNPVEPPRQLRPTLDPAGYLQSPPLILTTLEAARALRGDKAISAIRVRAALNGCPASQAPETCPMTPAAQRKIEAIAIEIAKQTGLDVDIMVGSSPKRILVHVPGIGYVEEQWIQKGVNLTYKQGLQAGNWLLLGAMLAAGGLYTLDLTWAEVVARRRLIALQKALGWRSRTVFAHLLGQALRLGAAAAAAGTLGALGMIWLLNWQPPPGWLLLGLPLAVLAIATLGSLLPAWQASRLPPLVELQHGGLHYRRSGPARLNFGLWAFAWSGLLRRPGRALLTSLTAVLSAALLVLLLAVTLQQQGMLSGTLLGEFLLVRIERFHYALVGIGLALAAFSTANSLLAGVLERQREIGVLKALGWRTHSVAWLFVLEGLGLGLLGGAAGALLGGLTFIYLYRSLSPALALALLAGVSVPGLVGALAALYPARVAARLPPAEALRYE